ncbi:MAG: hypothetical protein EAZ92_16860 [Candidatus Kapaibacterium sp.]|nr:MAG: hypothetical protein EAZ92_16860 [Candidatus Kapabacteria bacterium]
MIFFVFMLFLRFSYPKFFFSKEMRLFWKRVGAALFFLSTATAFAQKNSSYLPLPLRSPSQVQFRVYSLEQGLSQSSVMGIVQDKRGFVWLATEEGVNRFDAYSFRIFRNESGDSSSISDSYTTSLCVDVHGTVWVGTLASGICAYEPHSERFVSYRYQPNNSRAISSNNIKAILQSRINTSMWIATGDGGINAFNPSTRIFTRFLHNPAQPQSIPSNLVHCLAEDTDGMLWLGTDAGVCRFNPTTGQAETFKHDPNNANSLAHNDVRAIAIDAQGRIWLATFGGGMDCFSPKSKTWRHYSEENQAIIENRLNCLLFSSDGLLWIGTHNSGVIAFDTATGQLQAFTNSPANPNSLGNSRVYALMEDRDGRLWVGTNAGGVGVYDPKARKFLHYRHEPTQEKSLSSNSVSGIVEDAQKRLWIGTQESGIDLFNDTDGTFTVFAHDPNNSKTLSNKRVLSIHQDPATQKLWVGTEVGLNLFDPATGTSQHYFHDPNNPASISNDRAYEVHIPPKTSPVAGKIWLGTFAGGLNLFDPVTERSVRFQYNPNDTNSVSNNDVIALKERKDSTLWVGTFGGGVSVLNLKNQQWTRFQHEPTNPSSISANAVTCFQEDSKGNFWIGTVNGLNRYDPETKSFVRYQKNSGFLDELVYAILEDKCGNFWISTNKGIVRFHPETKLIRQYDVSDGLQSNEYNSGAFKTSDGRMFFGGINGFNLFHPDSIQDQANTSSIVLTGFRKFNKNTRLDTSITEAHTLTLPYSDNFISFEFTQLNYTNPQKNRYAYKLEGFDSDWIEAGTVREATYTNLDPGDYIFRVKAANHDGIWSEREATVRLVVMPPWWRTWWFRLLVALSAAGVIAGVFQWRTRQISVRNRLLSQSVREQTAEISRQMHILDDQAREIELRNSELQQKNLALEELNREKTEFLGIAAHDLKNPLASIILTAENLQRYRATMKPDQAERLQENIRSTASRMKSIIERLLDVNVIESGGMNLNIEECDFPQLVRSTVEEYRARATAKNITLHVAVSDESIRTLADEAALHTILENLISNAIKYSPFGRNVFVQLGREGGMARCDVQDEGPGFSEDDQLRLFGKYTRLTPKPTGGEHSTGLGLSIVKRMIEMQRGHVWCSSKLGEGATFSITLPLVDKEQENKEQ